MSSVCILGYTAVIVPVSECDYSKSLLMVIKKNKQGYIETSDTSEIYNKFFFFIETL